MERGSFESLEAEQTHVAGIVTEWLETSLPDVDVSDAAVDIGPDICAPTDLRSSTIRITLPSQQSERERRALVTWLDVELDARILEDPDPADPFPRETFLEVDGRDYRVAALPTSLVINTGTGCYDGG